MILEDKIVVVTNAGSETGGTIATVFAEHGATVIVSDKNKNEVNKTVEDIKSQGGKAVAIVCDVIKEEDIQNLLHTAVNMFGTVDILVNTLDMHPTQTMKGNQLKRQFAIQTISLMRAMGKVLPIFLHKHQGLILNVVSADGCHDPIALQASAASQQAVIRLTKNFGCQFAEKGVRCNAITVRNLEDNMAFTFPNDDPLHKATERYVGNNEEIAEAALFLASDELNFATGSFVTVDGRWVS